MRSSKISAQEAGHLGGLLLSLIIVYWIGSAVEDRSQMEEYYYSVTAGAKRDGNFRNEKGGGFWD